MASGLSNTSRVGGLATGVAAWGVLFQDRVQSSVQQRLHRPEAAMARQGGRRRASSRPGTGPRCRFPRLRLEIDELAIVTAVVIAISAAAATIRAGPGIS